MFSQSQSSYPLKKNEIKVSSPGIIFFKRWILVLLLPWSMSIMMLLRVILWAYYWSGWLVWIKGEQEWYWCGTLGVTFWVINLLNPTEAKPIIFWMLSTMCAAVTLSNCLYQHMLSSSTGPSTTSISWQQTHLSACVFTYKIMYGYCSCVGAAGMLTCCSKDMSLKWKMFKSYY